MSTFFMNFVRNKTSFSPANMFICKNKKKIEEFFEVLFSWLTKNILISGCIIYPIKNTCFANLEWTNINDIEKVQIESEAWAKAWPQNKNSEIIETYVLPHLH